jgi:hypothetical protein
MKYKYNKERYNKMSTMNLLFFRMTIANPLVNEISSHYKGKEDFDVSFYEDEKQTTRFFSQSQRGIFFFTVNSKEELKAVIKILRSQRKAIQKGFIKPTCILARSNKKIELILGKYNCKEILPADIQPRSAVYKIDFWAKQIIAQTRRHLPEAEKESEVEKDKPTTKTTQNLKSNIISLDALDHESDIWLIKQKTDTKKILRRWLLRVVGPSPQACKWEEVLDSPNKSQKTWRLKFLLEDNEFYSSEGEWLFEGSKPEFDWKMKRWNFSSENPHLYFLGSGSEPLSRFKLNESNIEVCENSNIAKEKEELIIKTFDSTYSFEKNKEKEVMTSIDFADGEEPGNLEGEVNDNSRKSSHMRGDNKETKEKENKNKDSYKEESKGGHLKGRVLSKREIEKKDNDKSIDDKDQASPEDKKRSITENLGGNLKGQVKSTAEKLKREKEDKDQANKEELERKAKKKKVLDELLNKEKDVEAIDYSPKAQIDRKKLEAKEQEERAKKNKVQLDSDEKSTRDKNKDSFQDKERTKPDFSNGEITEKERKEREKGEFSDTQSGNLGGKNSTDQVDHSPLGSKISKTAELEKKEREKGEFTDSQSGNLGGKNSTDQVDRSPLGSKINKSEQAGKKETEKGSFDPANLNDMDGKSSTDQIDRSPLGSKTQKQADLDKREREKSKFKEESLNNNSGKSSTDQLDRSPLGSKIQKEHQEKKNNRKSNFSEGSQNDLDGKGSTDELDRSHYSNKKSIDHRKEKKEREAQAAAAQKYRPSPDGNNQATTYGKVKTVDDEGAEVEYGSVRTPDRDKKEQYGSVKESSFEDALNPKLDYEDGQENFDETSDEPEMTELESLFAKPSEVSIESGRLNVSIEQSTAAGNAITFLCDFDDFYPEELSVQAPKNSLTVGEQVSAKVTLKYNSSRKEVVVKGQIIEVESFDDRLDHLVIQIERINKSDYEQFVSLYNDRQSQIMEFLEKAKGF